MWLIITEPRDPVGAWAVECFRSLGVHDVSWLTTDDIVESEKVVHEIRNDLCEGHLRLHDGMTLNLALVDGVLNRVFGFLPRTFQSADPEDKNYAGQEFYSFLLSFLHAFQCPIYNPASPQSLNGACHHQAEWIWMAGKVGFETTVTRLRASAEQPISEIGQENSTETKRRTLFAVNGHATTAIPDWIADCLHRLARLARIPLLRVEFVDSKEKCWVFAGASAFFDLRESGQAILRHLIDPIVPFQKELWG